MTEKHKTSNLDSRAFHRRRIQSPVRLRIDGEENPFTATLYDYSKGGLGLATQFLLPQSTVIQITTPVTFQPGNVLQSLDAQIVWFRQEPETHDIPVFDLGCRWLVMECDCCHTKVPYRQLHCSEDSVCLCPDCLNELDKKLNGPLKQNIHRFLLGNVI